MTKEELSRGVCGLVLAGGASRRMGKDKGLLDYHGLPQAVWLWQQLEALCERAYVSVTPRQSEVEPYTNLPTILDNRSGIGPATGLISAWESYPGTSWLVAAVDMPFIDRDTFRSLFQGRRSALQATAYRHSDGTLEPLCAIWEAAAQPLLVQRICAGDSSLRRCLEAGQVEILAPPVGAALTNVNSIEEYREAARVVATR